MAKYEILESFRWLPPNSLQTIKRGAGKKVLIKGKALFAGAVSRNLRKYVKEELVRAARSFVGKPITVNHDTNKIIGTILDMEEEDGILEYVGEITNKTALGREYGEKLLDSKTMKAESYYKKWLKNPIQNVSVEADYRHNRCVYDGQEFYDQESFLDHMLTVHKQKNFKVEPRGIIGKFLSVVEDPEKPGVTGTTIELVETAQSVSRLMETLTTDLKNEIEWKKTMAKTAAVTPEKRIAAIKPIKEQEEEGMQPPAHPTEEGGKECPEGSHYDKTSGGCVPDEIKAEPAKVTEQTVQDLPQPTVEPAQHCPQGFTYDEESGTCKPDEIPAETPPQPAPLMVPEPQIEIPKIEVPTPAPAPTTGPVLEQEGEGMQPPAPFPTATPEAPATVTRECPPNSHYDDVSGTCIPDEIVEQPPGLEGRVEAGASIVTEIKLPPMLKLGEPFADYKDFDDCVAKNRGKVEDPEAYCVTIKRKTDGETVSESVTQTFPYIEQINRTALIRDIKIAETANTQNMAIANLTKTVQNLAQRANQQTLTESRLRAAYQKGTLSALASMGKNTVSSFSVSFKNDKALAESFKKLVESTTNSLAQQKQYINKKLAQLATANAKTTAKVLQQKKDYETILAGVEGKFEGYQKTMEQRLKEQEDELTKRDCPEGMRYDKETGTCVPTKEAEELEKMKEELKKDKDLKETTNLEERMSTVEENMKTLTKSKFRGQSDSIKPEGPPAYEEPFRKEK